MSHKDLGIDFPLQFRRFTAEYDNAFSMVNKIKHHLIHSFDKMADNDLNEEYEVPN